LRYAPFHISDDISQNNLRRSGAARSCKPAAPPVVRWRADAKLFKQMARYGVKGHIWWAATVAIYRVDLLIVNRFRGAAEAGVYAVASQAALLLILLPTVVGQLLFSRVAATQDDGGEFTCLAARYTALLLFVACIISAPGALLLPALYGKAFVDAPIQLWLLLPGVYFIGVQSVLVQYFVGTGLPRAIPALWVGTLALNIALNLIFVPSFGARGAALVSTVSYAFIFIAVLLYFRARTGNKLTDALLLRRADLRLLAAAFMSRRG